MANVRYTFLLAACTALFVSAAMGEKPPAASLWGNLLLVDDDGAQCPGALKTIQEAVAKATPGTTILVCPGEYYKSVTISGADKEAVKLIAVGGEDEVVLIGDHTESFGFYLKNVNNVLIRGFTIRDFGSIPTTPSQFGWGCAIHLENAHYNVLENNRATKTDMMGITLSNSGNNTVRYNFIFEIDPKGFGSGIYLEGKKSTDNYIFQNYASSQPGGGVILWGAGTGNVISGNEFSNNGQWGISHRSTGGTLISGNRFNYNAGAWGVITSEKDRSSIGIELIGSDKVTVQDNMARTNTRWDISWDGKGDVTFSNNACAAANQAGLCGK